jgi:hypothetical protein
LLLSRFIYNTPVTINLLLQISHKSSILYLTTIMQSHRKLIGVSVLVASLGVGFIIVAFATDRWIYSSPEFVGNDNATVTENGKHNATIMFGLFTGFRSFDYGFSPRQYNLKIACDVSEQACAIVDELSTLIQNYKNQTDEGARSMEWFGLFSFPIYVTTLVMLILAVISEFLAIGFGVFNVFGRPIETITGPSGLYVWNMLAFMFAAASIGTYLSLYFSQLKVNILSQKDLTSGFTSEGHTDLDYSFFLVVAAAICFILNIFLLFLSGQKCSCHYLLTGEKEVDNGMILY